MKKFIVLFSLTIVIKYSANCQTLPSLQSVTDAGNTTSNPINIDPNMDASRSINIFRLNNSNNLTSRVALNNNKANGQITWSPDVSGVSSYALNIGSNSLQYFNNGTYESIWRSGNMGANSGLDADLLDGFHAGSFAKYNYVAIDDINNYSFPGAGIYFNATYLATNGVPNNNYATYIYMGRTSPMSTSEWSYLLAMGTNNGNLYTKRMIAGTWETTWRTIWDSNNLNPDNFLAKTGGDVSGDINIGTTTSQHNLNVNGIIKARKVKVSITDWPDYVFLDTYQLPSLAYVKNFIKENHRLPGVIDANSALKDGIDVSENQQILLQKIEELTLYTIEQQEKIDEQMKINEKLEERLARLEMAIRELREK